MALVDLICKAANGSHTRGLREATDEIVISKLGRTTPGPASLWNDAFTTEIRIGGGASQGLISIGKAGAGSGVRLAHGPVIEDSGISSPLALELEAVGADLILGSYGYDIALNEASDLTLNPRFGTTALVGALNALKNLSRPSVGNRYTNNTGLTLAAGTLVYIAGSDAIAPASAAADNGESQWIGALERLTSNGDLGRVISEGSALVRFGPGEGAADHATKEVYLSVTAGLGTLTPPSASGQVIHTVGYVLDSTGYDNVAGGTMLVLVFSGPRRVLP